jgi:hypothetical protein
MRRSHRLLLKRDEKGKIQRDSGPLLPCFFNTLIAQEHLVAGIIPSIVKDASTSTPVAMPRYNRFADHFKAHTPSIKLFHIINAPQGPEDPCYLYPIIAVTLSLFCCELSRNGAATVICSKAPRPPASCALERSTQATRRSLKDERYVCCASIYWQLT